MSGDPQDVAEAFDDDVTAGDDRGADDLETYDPPDRPLVVDHSGDESRPDQVAETLAERVRREEPEVRLGVLDDDDFEVGALVGDVGTLDQEPQLVALAARRAAEGDDLVPAEEAALHLTDDPPMLPLGDGYLDDADGGDGPDDGSGDAA